MNIVEINNEYFLENDGLQYTLRKKRYTADGTPWRNGGEMIGHYPWMSQALKRLSEILVGDHPNITQAITFMEERDLKYESLIKQELEERKLLKKVPEVDAGDKT